ncbi:MAG: hypothetical protein JW786_13095 [Desulfobacterales bacterium]|nr:hypothetical protein [Desulfobacterales bacterium]
MTSKNNSNEAFIKVSENATNFKMIDGEFLMGESKRPIIETKAKDTTLIGNVVSTNAPSEKRWFEKPFGVVALGVAASLLAWLIVHLCGPA